MTEEAAQAQARSLIERLRFDASTVSLIGANFVTIGIALLQGWPLAPVLWIYWGQSVIIGLWSFVRILSLKEFSTEGVRINRRAVEPTPETKRKTAFFFLAHYGFFHLIYLFFLCAEVGTGEVQGWWVALCLGAFFANHTFSFAYNLERDRSRRPNIGTVMIFPYARIIPMHLAILTGVAMAKTRLALAFFLLLKTLADLLMHAVEHREEAAAAAVGASEA